MTAHTGTPGAGGSGLPPREAAVDYPDPRPLPDPGTDPLLLRARKLLDGTPDLLLQVETALAEVRASLALHEAIHQSWPVYLPLRPE
jgi:hypothetical protein